MAALPYVQDVVITGEGRDSVGMLVFLAPAALRLSTRLAPGAGVAALAADPDVRAWAQRLLADVAAAGTGSSNRIVRALLMCEPPSAARGEVTDKGSINQRAVLKSRADLVDTLYDDHPGPGVLHAQPAG
jgi:feruloyl-CoA synthase